MDSEVTDLAGVKTVTISTLQVKPSEGAFADGDKTKLDGIAAGAQVNVSGDSGNAAVYDNSGTPTLKSGITKTEIQTLINVEDGADVTDTDNVTTAGALMDSEVTDLDDIKKVIYLKLTSQSTSSNLFSNTDLTNAGIGIDPTTLTSSSFISATYNFDDGLVFIKSVGYYDGNLSGDGVFELVVNFNGTPSVGNTISLIIIP